MLRLPDASSRAHLTGQFTLRSGASSDSYFNKYAFEADPVLLREIAEALGALLPDQPDAVAGLELGGVPLAAVLSQLCGLPTVFVRKQAKTYGTRRLAEGIEIHGKRLIAIEDVITTAGQAIESVRELRELGSTNRDGSVSHRPRSRRRGPARRAGLAVAFAVHDERTTCGESQRPTQLVRGFLGPARRSGASPAVWASERPDCRGMLRERRSTCSTKHLFLARRLAERFPETEPLIVHRVYQLDRSTAQQRYGEHVAKTLPRTTAWLTVHRYLTIRLDGQRVTIDATFPGPAWDGHSALQLACGAEDDHPASENPDAEKRVLEAEHCDSAIRERFITALTTARLN